MANTTDCNFRLNIKAPFSTKPKCFQIIKSIFAFNFRKTSFTGLTSVRSQDAGISFIFLKKVLSCHYTILQEKLLLYDIAKGEDKDDTYTHFIHIHQLFFVILQ